jgi:hypothetical protein
MLQSTLPPNSDDRKVYRLTMGTLERSNDSFRISSLDVFIPSKQRRYTAMADTPGARSPLFSPLFGSRVFDVVLKAR